LFYPGSAGSAGVTGAATNRQLAGVLLFATGVILYLSFGYTEMAGSDMWWHLAAGRELLQTRSLWMVDAWSYTAAGEEWLNHEWLADIIFYAWVSLWSVEAIVYWKWLVLVATFSILQYVLYRETGSHLAALLCAVMAVAIAAPFIDVRPHLYSLLNYSLLLVLLLGRQARTWVLILLFLLWVNLHGGFFFGLMALGILLFPWREFSLDRLRAALVLCCLLAASLNPSGLKTFLYPLTYAFDTSSPYRGLGEWLGPFREGGIRSPLFFIFMWAPALALLYLLPPVRRATGVPLEGLLLTALTLAMALTSRRFIPLFGMSLALLLAPLVALACRRLLLEKYAALAALPLLAWGFHRLAPYPLQAAPAFHYLTAEYSYPVDLLDFIEANGIRGNVWSYYNWGGYLHWRTDGGLKVFIDGRADTVYHAEAYREYVAVLGSQPDWIARVEASGAEYMLWPHFRGDGRDKLRELVATGRWRPVYRDATGWLLARRQVELPELKPGPDTPWRNLSGAQLAAWRGDSERTLEYGRKVLESMPWNKGACNLVTSAYRGIGQEAGAQAVLATCRDWFPSKYLR
jgi:hypothetical protein